MRTVYRVLAMTLLVTLLAIASFGCNKKENNDQQKTTAKSTVKSTSSTSSKTGTTTAKTTTKATTGASNTDDEKEDNGDDVDNGQDENGDQDENDDQDGSVPEDVLDLGGRVIKIMTWTLPETSVPFHEARKKIEAKYNCKVEIIGSGIAWTTNVDKFLTDLLAGICDYDMAHCYVDHAFPKLADNGLIVPIDEYVEDFSDELKNIVLDYDTIWRNMHYGISRHSHKVLQNLLYYNSNMLAAAGIPDIDNYYVRANNWTWDEFLEVAVKTTQDLNGDGVVDQYGITSAVKNLAPAFIFSNGGKIVEADENGVYHWMMQDYKVYNALQFMSDLFNTYKVTTNGTGWNPFGGYLQAFYNGKATMLIGPHVQMYNGIKVNRPDGEEFVTTFFPKGPDAPDQGYMSSFNLRPNLYVIPHYVENPQDVIRIYAEILLTEQNDTPEEVRQAAKDANRQNVWITDRDRQWHIEWEEKIGSGEIPAIAYPIQSFDNLINDLNSMYSKVASRTVTAVNAIEEITPRYVQLLEEYQKLK